MTEPSEALLRKTWREAVFAVWGDMCVISNKPATDAHHVVKRRNGVLRWDVQNGRPLAHDIHMLVEDNKIKIPLTEYLREFKQWDLKTWLTRTGQTKAMFLADELAELRTAIQNPIPYRRMNDEST